MLRHAGSNDGGEAYNTSSLKNRIEWSGLFDCGGPGTYFFLGSSDCGKNYLLEHQIRQAVKCGTRWEQVLVISSTAAHSTQWKFLHDIFYTDNICFRSDPEYMLLEHEQRKKECEDMMNSLNSEEDYEIWKRATQRLTIVDDQAGLLNLTASSQNPFYNYVATNRHVSGYCCILIQFRSNTGPGFLINSRAIMSFAGDDESIKKIFSNLGYPGMKDEKDKISEWVSNDYHWILYFNKLKINERRPTFPIFVHPVKKNKSLETEYF